MNQKGIFSIVIVLIIIGVLVAGGGIYWWQKSSIKKTIPTPTPNFTIPTMPSTPTTPAPTSDETADWITYQGKNHDFSFKAPTNCLTQDFDSNHVARLDFFEFDCVHTQKEIEEAGRVVNVNMNEERAFKTKDDAIKIAESYCLGERTGASVYCDRAVKQTEFVNNNGVRGYEFYLNQVFKSCEVFDENDNPTENPNPKCSKSESTIGPVFLLDISKNGVGKSLFVRGDEKIINKILQSVAILNIDNLPSNL